MYDYTIPVLLVSIFFLLTVHDDDDDQISRRPLITAYLGNIVQ